MRSWFPIPFLALGALLVSGPSARAAEFAPLPAAEAERAVAEEVNFLTDILWVGVDEYFHAGDREACVRLSREIVFLDPAFIEAYMGAAWMLWSDNRDEEAVALYEQGLAANPTNPDLYFDLGFYYRDRKQYDKSLEAFRQVVKYEGTKEQQHMLPNTLEEAGRNAEALTEWRALAGRFPKDPVAPQKITRLERELNQKTP